MIKTKYDILFSMSLRIKRIIYLIIISLVFVVLFVRCKYGIVSCDESFYLTIPYRMLQGDVLFLNEWFPTQLSGLLLYPIMKIVIGITNSTESLILIFRYIYLILQFITSIILYFSLRKYSEYGSMIGSVLFFIFAPHSIMALSYNSMGVMTLALSLTLFTVFSNKLTNILSGILFSCSVLCCPYLIILYGIYLLAVIINIKFKKFEDLLSLNKFLWFTAGVILIFLIFVIYILRNMTIKQFITILPYTLNLHDNHQLNIVIKIKQLLDTVITAPLIIKIILFVYIVATVVGRFCKKTEIKNLCFLIVIINSIVNTVSIVFNYNQINVFMLTPMFCAISTFLIYKNKKISNLFYAILLPTLIYCFCIHLSSDQIIYAIAQAAATSVCASIVIILFIYKEKINDITTKKIIISSIMILIVLQAFEQLKYRIKVVPFDYGLEEQTIYVDQGINKGLLVSSKMNELWNDYEYDISTNLKSSKVLLLTHFPWAYLLNNYSNCSYTAYPIDNEAKHLLDYYSINKDKLPEEIYVDLRFGDHGTEAKKIADAYKYELKTITKLGNYVYVRKQ